MIPMLKKLASLLLSLLLCLSLLPGQARAAGTPEEVPPAPIEAPEAEREDDLDALVVPMGEDAFPGEAGAGHSES